MTLKHKIQIYHNLIALVKLTGTKILKEDKINDLFETPIDLAEYVLELVKRECDEDKK